MPKGVAKDALANSGTANTAAAGYNGNASSLYGSLAPALMSEATNPQGYGAANLAKMNMASQQSLGGSNAGVTGQAGLEAARTRNAGGSAAVLDAGSQNAIRQNSQNAVGIQNENAKLEQMQAQEGLSGLSSLYGTNVTAGIGQQGLSNQALGTAEQADENNPWMKVLQSGIQAGGQVAGAALGSGGAWHCWVAAELYGGWDDARTIAVRRWIFGDFAKTCIGRVVCPFYLRFGAKIAELIRKYRLLRKPIKFLFDCALRRAER